VKSGLGEAGALLTSIATSHAVSHLIFSSFNNIFITFLLVSLQSILLRHENSTYILTPTHLILCESQTVGFHSRCPIEAHDHPRDPRCSEDITAYLLFEANTDTFVTARNNAEPSCFDWESDGCTAVPNIPLGFDFRPACWRHDFGYRNYKIQQRFTRKNRKIIDRNFLKDLVTICRTYQNRWICDVCRIVYFCGVRVFGSPRKSLYAAIAAFFLLAVVILLVVWCCKRRRSKMRNRPVC
jgi:hypothetical protein